MSCVFSRSDVCPEKGEGPFSIFLLLHGRPAHEPHGQDARATFFLIARYPHVSLTLVKSGLTFGKSDMEVMKSIKELLTAILTFNNSYLTL